MSKVTDTSQNSPSLPRKSHQNGKTAAPAPPNTTSTTIDGKSIPPETEPCLLNDSTNGKSANGGGQFGKVTVMVRDMEDLVRDKSGLSRRGVYYLLGLIVLLFVLVLVVVTLAACWPRISHEHEFPVCGDGACLRASAQIREALDNSVSPCSDIWTFSCGGWLKQHNLPLDRSSWDQKRQLLKLEAAKIGELVNTLPLPVRIGTVDWKLKYFYEACLDVDSTDAEKARSLRQIISDLEGWYILKDWNMESFDDKALLQKLHVQYGATPYFKISVQPHPGLPGTNTIVISPSGLGLPDRNYYYGPHDDPIQQAYQQLIRDVVMNMDALSSEAKKFGGDIFFYEKRIAEITPDLSVLSNPINTYNPMRVSDLKVAAATLPLQDILSAMFPSAITEETEVIVTSLDYLQQVSQIVATSDRATVNSYMMWTLVREYLPYLSRTFTESLHDFQSKLYGNRRILERWEFCSNVLNKYMGVAINYKLYQVNRDTAMIVQDIFDSIKRVSMDKLAKFKSMPELHRHLTRKVSLMKLQIGLPRMDDTSSFLQNYYSRLTVLKKNLFASITNSIHFKNRIEETKLLRPEIEEQFLQYTALSYPEAKYIPALNTIIIPNILLREPMYENKYPRPVLYGRLGVEISNAIAQSILPFDSSWTADSKLLSAFHSAVNQSINSLQSAKACIRNQAIGQKLTNAYFANITTQETVKNLFAVNIAAEALKLSSEKNQHIHQPSLEFYEDDALFFISYAQTQCSNITRQQDVFDSITRSSINKSAMLQIAWQQIPFFSGSLKCDIGTQFRCSDLF